MSFRDSFNQRKNASRVQNSDNKNKTSISTPKSFRQSFNERKRQSSYGQYKAQLAEAERLEKERQMSLTNIGISSLENNRTPLTVEDLKTNRALAQAAKEVADSGASFAKPSESKTASSDSSRQGLMWLPKQDTSELYAIAQRQQAVSEKANEILLDNYKNSKRNQPVYDSQYEKETDITEDSFEKMPISKQTNDSVLASSGKASVSDKISEFNGVQDTGAILEGIGPALEEAKEFEIALRTKKWSSGGLSSKEQLLLEKAQQNVSELEAVRNMVYGDNSSLPGDLKDKYSEYTGASAARAAQTFKAKQGTYSSKSIGDNASAMTEEENNVYYAILSEKGWSEAQKFYKELEPYLKKRHADYTVYNYNHNSEVATEYLRNNNLGAVAAAYDGVMSAASVVTNTFVKPAAFVSKLVSEDPNFLTVTADTLDGERQRISNHIAEDSELGAWLYQTGMSAADMALGLYTGSTIGGFGSSMGMSAKAVETLTKTSTQLIMSSSAGYSAIVDAEKRGLSRGQAIAYGLSVAAIEAVTERFSIEQLFKNPNSIIKNILAEGSEEITSELLGNVADIVINGDEAVFKKNIADYISQGLSEKEALEKAIGDLAKDALLAGAGGALLGGLFSGGNKVMTNKNNNIVGTQILQSKTAQADIEALINTAMESGDSELINLAETVKSTKYDFGELGTTDFQASAKQIGALANGIARFNYSKAMAEQEKINGKKRKLKPIDINTATNVADKMSESSKNTVSSESTVSSEQAVTEPRTVSPSESALDDDYYRLFDPEREKAVKYYMETGEFLWDSDTDTDGGANSFNGQNSDPELEAFIEEYKANRSLSVEGKDSQGNLILSTESGKEITYDSSVQIPDQITKDKLDYAQYLAPSGADAYLKLAPQSGDAEFNETFETVYGMGKNGNNFKPVESSVPYEAQKLIYNAGVLDLENAAATSQREVQEAKQKDAAFVKQQMGIKTDLVTVSDSAVAKIKAAPNNSIRQQYRASVRAMEAIGTILQTNINIVASETDANGNYISPNGSYNPETNSFTFDILSGMDHVNDVGYSAMLKTAGHELTHYIQNWSPEKYAVLKKNVLEFLVDQTSEDVVQEKLDGIINSNLAAGKELTLEQAQDELVADSFEDVLSKVDFAERIQKTDKSLFQKIRDWLRDHIAKFKKDLAEALKNVGTQTDAGKVMEEAGDRALSLYNQWADAFDTAYENSMKSAEAKNERDANTQYSLRGIRKDGIEVYETSEETKKLSYKERKKRFLDLMRNEYRGRTARFYKNGHYYYANFSEDDVRKTIYGNKRSDAFGKDAIVNQGADGSIFELVENAEYGSGAKEQGKTTDSHKDVIAWDYFVKTIQIDGKVYDLVANIRKKAHDSYVYSLQLNENRKTKAEPSHILSDIDRFGTSSQNDKVTNRTHSASTNSISPTPQNVNTKNKDTSEQFQTRNAMRGLGVVARRDIVAILEEHAASLSVSKRMKLEESLREYRVAIDAYDDARADYQDAVKSGDEDLISMALATMAFTESVVKDIEADGIISKNFAALSKSTGFEIDLDEHLRNYKAGLKHKLNKAINRAIKHEQMVERNANRTIKEFRMKMNQAERAAFDSARKAENETVRRIRAELRRRRDYYSLELDKATARLHQALNKPNENSSVPQGGEACAESILSVIEGFKDLLRAQATPKPGYEWITLMNKAALAEEKRAERAKSAEEKAEEENADVSKEKIPQSYRGIDDAKIKSKLGDLIEESKSILADISTDIKNLQVEYDALKDSRSAYFAYNKDVADFLKELIEINTADLTSGELTLDYVRNGIRVLNAVSKQLREANQMMVHGKKVDGAKLANRLGESAKNAPPVLSKLLKKASNYLMPEVLLNASFGAGEATDEFYSLYQTGQKEEMRYVTDSWDHFDKLLSASPKLKKYFTGNHLEIHTNFYDTQGKEIVLRNWGDAISWVLNIRGEDNRRHMVWGGIKVPDDKGNKGANRYSRHLGTLGIKDYIAKEMSDSEIDAALKSLRDDPEPTEDGYLIFRAQQEMDAQRESVTEAKLTEELVSSGKHVFEQLPVEVKEILSEIEKYYNGFSKPRLDKATLECYGFTKTMSADSYYYPIDVVQSQVHGNEDSFLKVNATIAGMGSMKRRIKSKASIELTNAITSLEGRIKRDARYCAWLAPIKAIDSITHAPLADGDNTITVTELVARMQGEVLSDDNDGNKTKDGVLGGYVKDLKSEISGDAKAKDNAKFVSFLHSSFVSSAIAFNISPPLKQFTALPFVAVESGAVNLVKGVANGVIDSFKSRKKLGKVFLFALSKAQRKHIAKYSVVYKWRSGGMLDTDFVALKNSKNPITKLMNRFPGLTGANWCEWADSQVLGQQFYALKKTVEKSVKQKGLDWDSEKINIEAGKLLDDMILRFQANSSVLQRVPAQRDGRGALAMLTTTFRSQPITIMNAHLNALSRVRTLTNQIKVGEGNISQLKLERRKARMYLAKVNAATLTSYIANAAVTILISLMYRRKEWDDEALWQDALWDFFNSYTGMIPILGDIFYYLAQELLPIMSEDIPDRGYYGDAPLSFGFLDTAMDAIDVIPEFLDNAKNGTLELKDVKRWIGEIAAPFGLPARNALNILNALLEWLGVPIDELLETEI